MGKVLLVLSVECEDQHIAAKVQNEFLPNLNDLLNAEGVHAVKAEWLAEAGLRD